MTDSAIRQVAQALEEISHLAKSSTDVSVMAQAIEKAKKWIQKITTTNGHMQELGRLDAELDTWLLKLPVIFKEPVGRQGMSKHAMHWVDQLKRMEKH